MAQARLTKRRSCDNGVPRLRLRSENLIVVIVKFEAWISVFEILRATIVGTKHGTTCHTNDRIRGE